MPPVAYACVGFCSVDMEPSPKSQSHATTVPSLSVLWSVNDATSSAAVHEKLAVGSALGGGP